MKSSILIIVLVYIVSGCTNKERQQRTIIGGADSITEITIAEDNSKQDRDTVIYEIPQCELWYTKELSEADKGKEICMWTECKEYWEDVRVINVFVSNSTNNILSFGRSWALLVWNGKEWVIPQVKNIDLSWQDDLFISNNAPLLYCFRFPVGEYYHLPKGKYCILKTFWQYGNGNKVDLKAEFEIK